MTLCAVVLTWVEAVKLDDREMSTVYDVVPATADQLICTCSLPGKACATGPAVAAPALGTAKPVTTSAEPTIAARVVRNESVTRDMDPPGP